MELNGLLITGLNAAVTCASAVVLWLIKQTGKTLEDAAKAAAEEGAKTAIKNINWPVELRQDLQKARGVGRQELRFKSYGELWKQLRPLAIYSNKPIDRVQLGELSEQLSDWYFAECGGMFLTPHARDFYFALQDFLRAVAKADDWECRRSDGDQKERFENIVDRMNLHNAAAIMKKLSPETGLADWPAGIAELSKLWRKDMVELARRWSELNDGDRFAVVQQVGSVLRTNLANDVESHLR